MDSTDFNPVSSRVTAAEPWLCQCKRAAISPAFLRCVRAAAFRYAPARAT